LDEREGRDAFIIDISKAFDSVPYERFLTKLTPSSVDSRAVVWVRQFLVGRTQRVRVGGQLTNEVKVTSVVLQENVLGPLVFLVYINDIWRNIDSNIRIFAENCTIYREFTNKNKIENLQKDLNTLGEWAVENGININLCKIKAIRFTTAQVKFHWVTLLVTKNSVIEQF